MDTVKDVLERQKAAQMLDCWKLRGVPCPLCGSQSLAVFPAVKKLQCAKCCASNDVLLSREVFQL